MYLRTSMLCYLAGRGQGRYVKTDIKQTNWQMEIKNRQIVCSVIRTFMLVIYIVSNNINHVVTFTLPPILNICGMNQSLHITCTFELTLRYLGTWCIPGLNDSLLYF